MIYQKIKRRLLVALILSLFPGLGPYYYRNYRYMFIGIFIPIIFLSIISLIALIYSKDDETLHLVGLMYILSIYGVNLTTLAQVYLTFKSKEKFKENLSLGSLKSRIFKPIMIVVFYLSLALAPNFLIFPLLMDYDLVRVTGISMKPTLVSGDRLLIKSEFDEFVKGRVYIINKNNEIFVKRLVGFPNDKIIIKNGRITLNNKPFKYQKISATIHGGFLWVSRNKANVDLALETDNNGNKNLVFLPKQQKQNIKEIILKPLKNQYVFIGDLRPNSRDSRSKNFGYIRQNEIKSEVVSIVHSSSKLPLHKDENRYLINLSGNNVEKHMKYTIKNIFDYTGE